ncbi:MAG: hypothetical protein GEU86_08955 [Actinophytocola sp.]|nr:hypothetical protein [Actinophytocola sp.]
MLERYAWADDQGAGSIESWTVAVVEGMSAEDVVRIYGGDPDRVVGEYRFAQLYYLQGDERSGYRFHLQVLARGDHVVALENHGYTGNLPEIARRCSADGGRSFSVYWSPSSRPQLLQAIDGQLTSHVDLCSGEEPYTGEPAPPWIKNLNVDLAKLRSTSLVLLEQQTGLAFDHDWLGEVRPTYRIPDPYRMLADDD